jgi:hypothetical protein
MSTATTNGSRTAPPPRPEPTVEPYPTLKYDPTRIRPVRWAWQRWLPIGKPATLVGIGGAGKGTLSNWIAAQITHGALPGAFEGEPRKVLIVGSEDGFYDTWMPRLIAAGGDPDMLEALDTDVTDIGDPKQRDRLAATLTDGFGLVLYDQLLDNIDGGPNGAGIFNPKQIRRALRATGQIAEAAGVAALSVLHPIKGQQKNFRDLVGGSHQFTDAARACAYVCEDPDDIAGARRWLGRGKGNLSAAPTPQTFRIVEKTVTINGYDHHVPVAVDFRDDGRTVDDLLASASHDSPVRDGLAVKLMELLTDEWQQRSELFRQLGRDAKDTTARGALDKLIKERRAEVRTSTSGRVEVRLGEVCRP